jgi:GT2 family glycosyltransferase
VPTASIAIPTKARAGYLEVALASVTPQAKQLGAEVLVISDGPDPSAAAISQRGEARFLALDSCRGANAARNAAVDLARSALIVFVDDDVDAPSGWLEALLGGVDASPDCDVFGGPIRPRLEGGGPRSCGRESAPITTLDQGTSDRDVALVWSANMAVRRRAFEQVGRFDETIAGRGEEEEWEHRYSAAGGRIRYIAAAGLDHRRTRADARIWPLSRAAYALGRTARRNDVRKGTALPLVSELRTLCGCIWHIVRRRCAIGIVLVAQSAGRVHETLAERSG